MAMKMKSMKAMKVLIAVSKKYKIIISVKKQFFNRAVSKRGKLLF